MVHFIAMPCIWSLPVKLRTYFKEQLLGVWSATVKLLPPEGNRAGSILLLEGSW